MNRVYKVIWSKAKHCYVVTSEIARSVTKSASSARSAGRKGAAVLAMAALLFTTGGMLGEAANVIDVTANKTGNVITVTKDVGEPTTITIDNVDSAKEAVKAYSDGDGHVIKNTYVKIANAKVSTDGEYVKVANTVGKNLSALDTQVKKNTEAVEGVVKAGEEVGEKLLALDAQVKANADAVAAEATARKTADQNNLKVGDDGVISKVIEDGTTSSPVNKLVLNKEGNNQITMDGNGIKVGKNSTTMDKNGFYAGSDYDYGTAKAALDATEGKIRGANGKFEVNVDGKVTANGGVNTAGAEINTAGGKITAGAITGTQLNTQGGDIIGGKATVTELTTQGGDISGGDITATGLNTQGGEINGGDIKSSGTIHADGKITGNGLDAGSGAINGKSLSVTGAIEGNNLKLNGGNLDAGGGTITTTGDIKGNNINATGKITTKDLEVTDGLKTDHMTLGDEPLNQTDINKGNVTSKIHETSGGVEYTAESVFNKEGSSITARTDEGAVDSTGKSKVGAQGISQYLGNNAEPKSSDKNVTRNMVRNDNGTFSMEDKAVDGDKSSTVSQNAEERKVVVDDGTKTLTVTENLTGGIVSETNDGAGKTVTLTQGMDGTYKVETSGTSTEEIGGQKIENYNGGLDTNITGDETHDVSGAMTTTVEGQATENFNGGLDTNITGDETHDVSGAMTTTVTGDSSLSAKNISNTAENGTITNTAQTVKTITGKNTVTSNTGGTTFTNEGAKTVWTNDGESGTRTDTKITGNKVETGKVMTDFADVNNNLTVGGSTTLGRDGNTKLTVNSKSTFRDTVKMEKTLEVDGESTFNNKVTITKGGLDVKGGTTTDTLTVTGDSEFVGRADFRDNVYMDYDLTVKGETRTGTLYVNNDGYVDGNLYVEGNIETHDAELSETSRQVVTGRQLYQTNERVDRLDNRIKKVGANAAALAALRPGDFNPDDKFSIAAGFGSYRNASAAALGLFYRPNENVILSLGTSFGDGENMVNAGVSVKFGRGKSMAERRKEMAEEVSVMRDEMRSQDERIAELEEMLKKQSELIEKLSKES